MEIGPLGWFIRNLDENVLSFIGSNSKVLLFTNVLLSIKLLVTIKRSFYKIILWRGLFKFGKRNRNICRMQKDFILV
jgi:hypothetical protein